MAAQLSREQQGITLRGSAEIVAEFFCKGLRAVWGRGETGAGEKRADGAAGSSPAADMAAGGAAPSHTPPRFVRTAYGINSILYQRGIYPPETFTRVQKYGLTLLVTTDPELKNYLNNVVEQMKGETPPLPPFSVLPSLPPPLPFSLTACIKCCDLFQSGSTSALCNAWWWSSPALRTMRCWSGGSSTLSVTRTPGARGE